MHLNLLLFSSPTLQCLLHLFRGEAPGGERVKVKQRKNCQEINQRHCSETNPAVLFVWKKFVSSSGVVPTPMTVRWIWASNMLPVRLRDLRPVSKCIRRARTIYLLGISALLELLDC
jgi:hypothetical protein